MLTQTRSIEYASRVAFDYVERAKKTLYASPRPTHAMRSCSFLTTWCHAIGSRR